MTGTIIILATLSINLCKFFLKVEKTDGNE